jgi:5-methylcytosine-specific restriction endonuclease McrA
MEQEAIRLHNEGMTKKDIAARLGIGYSTVRKYTQGLTTVVPNTKWTCRTCGKDGQENFYAKQPYRCKTCWNKTTYKAATDKIAEYMESRGGAKCMSCGYDKYIGALEFHHRDPSEKDPKWSRGWNLTRLAQELDKCDILCANCHREAHAEMRG